LHPEKLASDREQVRSYLDVIGRFAAVKSCPKRPVESGHLGHPKYGFGVGSSPEGGPNLGVGHAWATSKIEH